MQLFPAKKILLNTQIKSACSEAFHVADKKENWLYDKIEWGWLENQSIIRGLQNGAIKRWKEGKAKEVKQVFQNLLKTNPNDNSGDRYHLLAIFEGMTVKEFDKKMGNSGFVPPTIPNWFDKKAKFHAESAELLKIWGDTE